jgi:predicted transcriptional regulator
VKLTVLLDEIIELATDDKQSISVLLRKCLILASQLKNDRLKVWANKELNGYGDDNEQLPDYRITPAQAVGFFNGPYGAQWNNFPIPPAVLEEKHKRFAMEVRLTQAISAYDDLVRSATIQGTITMNWPTNLVLYYQQRIPNSKGMILNHAYQEIPKPSLVEMLDTVRNRVLNMALEIKSEVGDTDADLKRITVSESKKVDQTIVNNIYGGNVYLSGGNSTMTATTIQQQQQNVVAGDWVVLERALKDAGIDAPELKELSAAVETDGAQKLKENGSVVKWIKSTAPKVLAGGVKMGAEVGRAVLTEMLMQYYGLK